MALQLLVPILDFATLIVNSIVLVLLTMMLIRYRIKKPYKRNRHETWKEVVETSMVELAVSAMFIALFAPEWLDLLLPTLTKVPK